MFHLFSILLSILECLLQKTGSPDSYFYLVRILCIWPEYGDLQIRSPYLELMRENTDQKKLQIRTLFAQCGLKWVKLL